MKKIKRWVKEGPEITDKNFIIAVITIVFITSLIVGVLVIVDFIR